ncbi:MAG: hypothetical protein WAV05_11145 [Anaerolineales bacterium]
MAFSPEVIKQAWIRSGGRCECSKISHAHDRNLCSNELVFENQGRDGKGAWIAHRININGDDSLSNCEILCWQCQKITQIFDS